MAWYALYKWFRTFRKSRYVNYISIYKKYLYDQWFNSLSEEDKQSELKRIELEEERRRRVSTRALNIMYAMSLYARDKWIDI